MTFTTIVSTPLWNLRMAFERAIPWWSVVVFPILLAVLCGLIIWLGPEDKHGN